MSVRLPPQEPARPRRAGRPTAASAASASVRAAARTIALLAGQPRRRLAQRRARIALGQAVARHLAGQPSPPFLAAPLAAHRAAQLRLASTQPPPRPGRRPGGRPGAGSGSAGEAAPPGGAPGPGAAAEAGRPPGPAGVASRASRTPRWERDLAARLERLLLVLVLFLPRLAARVRLRAAEERLGAWATGLIEGPDPALAAVRERAATTQRAAASARAAAAASWREAVDAARLAVSLVAEAVTDLAGWVAHGLRSGSSMLAAWLVSLAVAARRRLRRGSAATRRGLRAGSAAAGRHVRAGSAATWEHLRSGSTATRRRLRAGSLAAGRGVRGAGAGVAAAAGGLAARIDALVDRGRTARTGAGPTPGPVHPPPGSRGPGSQGAGSHGSASPPPGFPPGSPAGGAGDLDGARNGQPDGPGPGRLVRDQGDPTEAWWLPAGPVGDQPTSILARWAEEQPSPTVPGQVEDQPPPVHGGGRVEDQSASTLAGRAGEPPPVHGGGRVREPTSSPAGPLGDSAASLGAEVGEPTLRLGGRVGDQPAPLGGRRARARHGRGDAGYRRVLAGMARPFLAAGARIGPVVTAMAAPPNRRRPGWLPFARPVAVALALTLLVATATAVPAAMLVADSVKGAGAGLPDLEELRQLRQPERTQVYDRHGRVIEVLKDEQDRIVVPLSKISPTLQQAVIAAEDARFYEHRGVDDRGILRAAVTNLLSGEVSQGGSTITQQLVRNSYPDLKDISIVRKVKEAALAAQLEGKLSKQEILHRYLNRVYFGAGFYGVEAASRGYFGRTAATVTLAQAATLAGVIREPVTADPRRHPRRAKLLRDSVLERMARLGMVSAADAAKAKRQRLGVRRKSNTPSGRFPWFIDGLKRQLLEDERLGRTHGSRVQRLFEGGLRIRTTLDRDMQLAAEAAVARWRPASGPDIALIAVDPRDGGVRAVVGGRNFKREAYNAAVQGVGRQPGSSFKTFVLAAALEAGISPDSVWESSGFQDQLVCGAPWSVDNYEGGGSGLVSVRQATWSSINGVYARLMAELCPDRVAAMAEKLGIPTIPPDKRVPSMALGSAEVRPIDMASAYGTLANLGEYHRPTFFERIDHRSGKPVIADPPKPERRVSAALAWQVTDILKGVLTGGTGIAANIGRPAAGKTGTNQEYRDAWFVGYTPQLSVAVWMGDPNNQTPMLDVNGRRVSGGSFPAMVWHDFMAAAMAGQEVLDWPRPPEQLTYTILPPPPTVTRSGDGGKRKDRKRRRPPGPPGRND